MAAGGTNKKNQGSLLDLFFLTFNCAKSPVDVDVFARHLRAALREKRERGHGEVRSAVDLEEEEERGKAALPDLVVL